MDALDLDVLEIRPVRGLEAEAVGQVGELQPHAVVVVLLEHDAADFLRHEFPPGHAIVLSCTIKAACLYRISIMPYRGPPSVGGSASRHREDHMVKKIALEEHVMCPGFEDYWK